MDVVKNDRKYRHNGVKDDYIKLQSFDFGIYPQPHELPVFKNKKRYIPSVTKGVNFGQYFFNQYPEFRNIDFSGLLIAGGVVLHTLASKPWEQWSPDIDIFIYHETQDEVFANSKVKHIVDCLKPKTKMIRVSGNAITLVVKNAENDNTHDVQIILRIYTHPSEVLHGFDLGCCSIGFDGKDLYATSLGLYCIKRSVNIIDISKRSTTYEFRLSKYFDRGFGMVCPYFKIQESDFPQEIKKCKVNDSESDNNGNQESIYSLKPEEIAEPMRIERKEIYLAGKLGLKLRRDMENTNCFISDIIVLRGRTRSDYDLGTSGIANCHAFRHAIEDESGMWHFDPSHPLIRNYKDIDLFSLHTFGENTSNRKSNNANFYGYEEFFNEVKRETFLGYTTISKKLEYKERNEDLVASVCKFISYESPWKICKLILEDNEPICRIFERQKRHVDKIISIIQSKTIGLYWLKNSPGSQFTGSFHPVADTEERWYGKYFDAELFELSQVNM